MPEFKLDSSDEFFKILEDFLIAKGLSHEASILKESKKEIFEYTSDTDWGITSIGYVIKLLLPTSLYVQLHNRTDCEQSLRENANEVFRVYEKAWIEEVTILLDTESKTVQNSETSFSKISRLREQVLGVCSDDFYSGPDDYVRLRSFLMQNIRFKASVPDFIKNTAKLRDLPTYIQVKHRVDERSPEYLSKQFERLLELSEQELTSPVAALLLDAAAKPDTNYILTAWQKALARRFDDPEGAITAARTLLESVCKYILDESGIQYDDKTDLPKLYGLVAKHLNMSPSQHSELVFRQILGSCQSIVDSLGSLRNRLSDAHGKSRNAAKPASRHAELAVNLAGTLTLFLIQTNNAQQRRTRDSPTAP